NLRALILDPTTPDFWTVVFEPSDVAPFTEQAIDTAAAVRNALANRTDLMAAKNSLDRSDIDIRFLRNQILPDVSAQVNYGAIGIGGVQLPSRNPFTGEFTGTITTPIERVFASALGDVFRSSYPQWTFGVQIGYPLGASTAH